MGDYDTIRVFLTYLIQRVIFQHLFQYHSVDLWQICLTFQCILSWQRT